MSANRLHVDLDEIEWLDTRTFAPRDEEDTLQKLRQTLRLKIWRYNRSGGLHQFRVESVPSQRVVVIWRKE